jgi:FkbM family methyltransferase
MLRFALTSIALCSASSQTLRPYSAAWAQQRYPGGELSDCIWAKAQVPGGFPPWEMCTYPKRFDVWLSRRIQEGRCFECDTVSLVLRLLNGSRKKLTGRSRMPGGRRSKCEQQPNQSTSPLLIDVGSNIGMYSLAAGAACFEALAYEPVPLNAYKLMASIQRNNMTGWVRLYTIGASDSYDVFDMGLSEANQGEMTHMPISDGTGGASSGGNESHRAVSGGGGHDTGGVIHAGLARIPVGPLSALIPPQPAHRPIFIKMDVEGGEVSAMTSPLLLAHVLPHV